MVNIKRGDPNVRTTSYFLLQGNGVSLYYRGRTEPSPGIPTSISVPLIESAWERTEGPDRGDTPISEYASREDLMMVLENVESIMIRGVYDGRQTTTRYAQVHTFPYIRYLLNVSVCYIYTWVCDLELKDMDLELFA